MPGIFGGLSFLGKRTGIGLDIGSKKTKLVQLKKAGHSLQIINSGSIATPVGVVEAGNILDPERLGEEIGILTRELNIKGKQVVSAVTGPQVYTRNIIMPRMKLEELKEAAIFQATTFLPIPVTDATIDIFPLRNFEDDEGKKTEVFFVAVRRQQVENLDLTCRTAGLKVIAVEIEPLAINRLINVEDDSIKAFLNIGASRSYFSVFKGKILLFHRSLSFGCSAFYQSINFVGGENYTGVEMIEMGQDSQHDYLVRDIMAELSRSIEYYDMQHPVEGIEKILLCGGGARIRGLYRNLTTGIGREVELMDVLANVNLPANIDEKAVPGLEGEEELRYDFPVALGLAAREVS